MYDEVRGTATRLVGANVPTRRVALLTLDYPPTLGRQPG